MMYGRPVHVGETNRCADLWLWIAQNASGCRAPPGPAGRVI